jgi:peptidoglycan glycosyltransferase
LQPQTLDSAALPIALDDLTVRCLAESPLPVESLQNALARSCPHLFAEFAVQYPAEVQEKIIAFGLLTALRLNGYPTAPELRSTPLDALRESSDRLRAALGQGDLRVTPLHMALVASGIANYGNVVTPYIAEALRAPDSETWEAVPHTALERAAMTRESAERMRAALREAVLSGSAQAAAQFDFPPEVTLYAHASLAFSGASQDGWLIGFVDLPDGRALAIAVVVEAADDAQIAARIGGQVLALAARRALPD